MNSALSSTRSRESVGDCLCFHYDRKPETRWEGIIAFRSFMDKYGKDKKKYNASPFCLFPFMQRELSNSNSLNQFTSVYTRRHRSKFVLIALLGEGLNSCFVYYTLPRTDFGGNSRKTLSRVFSEIFEITHLIVEYVQQDWGVEQEWVRLTKFPSCSYIVSIYEKLFPNPKTYN